MKLTPNDIKDIIEIAKALTPAIAAGIGIMFKLKQKDREEIAHALDWILNQYSRGEIEMNSAKNHLLGTGLISGSKVDKLLSAVSAVKNTVLTSPVIYTNTAYPGVGVNINADGTINVNAKGLVNKLAHKLSKYLKKRFNITVF
jgi:hypothetical protein